MCFLQKIVFTFFSTREKKTAYLYTVLYQNLHGFKDEKLVLQKCSVEGFHFKVKGAYSNLSLAHHINGRLLLLFVYFYESLTNNSIWMESTSIA